MSKIQFLSVAVVAIVSSFAQAQVQQTERIVSDRGVFESKASLPTFSERGQLGQFATRTVSEHMRARQDQFAIEARRDRRAWTGEWEWRGYAQELSFDVTWNRADWISVSVMEYWYTGGAHPNSVIRTFNFVLDGNRPRLATYQDLFERGFDARSQATNAIMGRLMRGPQGNYVFDGIETELSEAQLNNFVIERGAIRWIFSPYEMGPYAMGYVEARVTGADALGLRRNVLAMISQR